MINLKPTVIDWFCGFGGLSYGFTEAGYAVVLGIKWRIKQSDKPSLFFVKNILERFIFSMKWLRN